MEGGGGNKRRNFQRGGELEKQMVNVMKFSINGIDHIIDGDEFDPRMSLAQYIREVAGLTGTKISCNEGGCGACTVSVRKNRDAPARSVNSCLTPVLLCDGWIITTIEGLGNKDTGYHPYQTKLASEGGSQCGYCSPGMVMQLHSWLQEHSATSELEIDNILDGNICRCTGYRPILDAFKSFASDKCLPDIEELKICKKDGKQCSSNGRCSSPLQTSFNGPKSNFQWLIPASLSDLLDILSSLPMGTKYRIISGNTGTGVYKNDGPYNVYINIAKVSELHELSSNSQVIIGGGVTITDAMGFLGMTGDPVFEGVAHHLKKIASCGIRNQGSLAGNLMMKHAHPEFPSDVFLCLETVGAKVEIAHADGSKTETSLTEFLNLSMEYGVIVSVKFPILEKTSMKKDLNSLWFQSKAMTQSSQWKFKTYKIMPRSSNAHAVVNAGFLVKVDVADNFKILERPRIVFGGINKNFVHAEATETFLINRNMNDHAMFLEAMAVLAEELIPEDDPILHSALYRKQLSLCLLYKFYIFVLGSAASSEVQTGCEELERGLSSGQQDWVTDESQWPVSKPVEKYEAKVQCSGEAEYVNDIPTVRGELHAAYVLTTRGNCSIASVDTNAALELPGVVSYVDANDIPGLNDWTGGSTPETIFCTSRSEYAGQAVGLIVALSRDIAVEAAKLVVIYYSNENEVTTDIAKSMTNPENVLQISDPVGYGDVDFALASSDVVLSGRFTMGSQYHYYLETQVCIVKPTEDGFDIQVPTQFITKLAVVVSKALKVPVNSVNVEVKRIGGGYGGKIYLPNGIAAAASVAAKKLNQPIRLWLPLEDNMRMLGKRNPYVFDYKIGFDKDRKITAVESSIFCDSGWNFNRIDAMSAVNNGQNCYHIPALKYTPFGVKTHTPANTPTRAPGSTNGHAMMEYIMEHAAAELKIDPLELKQNNLMNVGSPVLPPPALLETVNPISSMINQLKTSSDYTNRISEAQIFNQSNKWKKRGLSLVPIRYPHFINGGGIKFHCLISVFANDGTISVAHSGIEMGQGLNTKVQQVVAKELGVEMNLIKIKPAISNINPNGFVTGGSWGSELSCEAAIKACSILNTNLAPIRESLGTSATWEDIVSEANMKNIDLCARYMICPENDGLGNYDIWGAVVTEVEVDILTGEMFVVRADIIEDAGLSVSPQVDVGQLEGAFIMGLGLWTSEQLKYHPTTGELLTKNTWEYKPPAAKDIPQDFRVNMIQSLNKTRNSFSGKATGEPPMLLSISVLFALRDAINQSRREAGLEGWWPLDGPATIEKIHQSTGISPDMFTF